MKNTFKKTLKLTVCAILAGLSFVALYLGTITGVFDLCAVVLGAVCIAFSVIEFGGMWPWLICAVTSVLSFVLLPDKMVGFEYLFLGGAYPILKYFFESRSRVVSWILKFVYFNVALTITLLVAKFVFPNDEAWQIMGVAAYVLGNIFFAVYDYALTTFISFYFRILRKKLKIKNMR
ncbi:MAG: hypothetical protein IKL36_07725 [Clostridia bacterium]|nr:hypothetical protein [Clostridia bacterium]